MIHVQRNNCLSEEDFEILKKEANKIHSEWFKSDEMMLLVKVNKKLSRSNGITTFDFHGQFGKITLSYDHYKQFGIKSLIYVLRHEIAHVITVYIFGPQIEDHGDEFKTVCRMLKGKMNKSVAGEKYRDCAWENYTVPNTKYKWKLVCPKCGFVLFRNRISKNLLEKYSCGCGVDIKKFDLVKIGFKSLITFFSRFLS